MTTYFDASVLVSLFVPDTHTPRVHAWLASARPTGAVSSWGAAEFSSALAFRNRLGTLAMPERAAAERAFDLWLDAGVQWVEVLASDMASARAIIRSDRVSLRTPDALHAAIALRLGFEVASVDDSLSQACENLGLRVAPI